MMRHLRLREVRPLAQEHTASQEETLACKARDLSSLLPLYMRSATGQKRCRTAGPSPRIASEISLLSPASSQSLAPSPGL